MQPKMMRPMLMVGIMFAVMILFMVALGLIFGRMNPMAMMYATGGSLGWGMWGVMLIPFAGLVAMLVAMFFAMRWIMRKRAIRNHTVNLHSFDGHNLTTHTFDIPSVHCSQCKMNIEQQIAQVPGVASVDIDIEAKQATIQLITPPNRGEIEALLAEIGYPAQSS